VGSYRVDVQGVPAHAGIEPEKGASAIHALQEILPALLALADPALGTTLNVGQLHGGTADNVVAAHCQFTVDVRMDRSTEARRVDAGIRQLAVSDPRIRVAVTGGINRPPMEPSETTGVFLAQVQEEAEALGFAGFQGGGTGGASDGNLLAAVGCPVIDGLGPQGSGAHTLEENILLADVPWRIRLYMRLLQRL
jgi:glutamate carboxypeptidase